MPLWRFCPDLDLHDYYGIIASRNENDHRRIGGGIRYPFQLKSWYIIYLKYTEIAILYGSSCYYHASRETR
jgi:hypothetical protein